jgi:hypothetical protein
MTESIVFTAICMTFLVMLVLVLTYHDDRRK